jgi:DNA (cytosine-5)-methyltransferase 1
VFVENVAALVNRGLDVVLADLAQAGYDAEWHCLSAADVGAPHKRERIFLVAFPCGFFGNSSMAFNPKYEIQRNKEWNATQNIKSGDGWKRWLIQINKTVGGQISQSDFFGVDDGISEELDRIKCLGNAVVPQCAEVFAEYIKEKLETGKGR